MRRQFIVKILVLAAFFWTFGINLLNAQVAAEPDPETSFWDKVSFGGGLGLSFGKGFFMGSISPSAIYNFNPYFSAGPGLSYYYFNDKQAHYRAIAYGGSIIALFNPIPEIQLSAELEGLQVDRRFTSGGGDFHDGFFQEALFLGAGYRVNNVTIGARYNVLFDRDRSIYASAFMPFVRVYF